MLTYRHLLAVLTAVMTLPVSAATHVDNFVLLDQHGKAHELYYQKDAAAVVLVSQSNHCNATSEQLKLPNISRPDSARVFLLNSVDSRAEIERTAQHSAMQVPVLHDSSQLIGPALGFHNQGDAVVINPANWEIIYQGPANHAGFGKAIQHLTSGQTAVTPFAQAAASPATKPISSCAIEYPETGPVASYAQEIVPILRQNCMACHVEGGIAPWAMSEYRMIQGFAPMMREVIRVKRMPPWHADPAIGQWQHSAALSDDDARTLVRWIEAGAPRGTGPDPLLETFASAPTWPLGEPDLILEIPTFEVAATGVVDYQFPVVENPLDRDVWVRAATIIPGNAQVVHHVLMGSSETMPEKRDREGVFGNYIMGYAPGNESAFMPEGTGVFVPVGGVYQFQLHYTPIGVATSDTTRVGLYFADTPPANFLRQQVVLNPRLKIPPNTADHEVSAYFEFWDEAIIYSLVPHAHYRGKSSTFELVYPDGQKELILSVPNYDFNWQRTYSFVEPKQVPKGTRIIHRTVYDNSAKNPRNPDPERVVPWGLQSFDEMLYGSISFSWANERSDAPLHSKSKADIAQFFGFLDQNMDGKLSKDELPGRMRKSLGWFKWWFVDKNFDGGLDLAEMEAMLARRSS